MNRLASAFRWIAVVALAASVFAGPLGVRPVSAIMAVWRVAPGGAATGACGDTWANACDLQYALASAASAPGELWVQQGTYLPTTGTDQTVSFVLRTGIAVFGGFEGDENARIERDYGAYVTALSGNIGDAGITSDNSYHVVSAPAGVDNTAVLDGFTITAGDAGAFSEPNSNGAGIYLYQASPTLTNLVITGNAAWLNGGGIYNYQGNPAVSYLTITGNRALRGGGMYSYEGTPDLEFVNFLANFAAASGTAASLGGGMYNYDSDADLDYVTFTSNAASASASFGGYGGGMYNDISNPTLTEVTFSNNSTSVFTVGDPAAGGGMYNRDSSPVLTGVDFSGNESTQGAGMMNVGGAPSLTDVTFSYNAADGDGGALYSIGSNGGTSSPSLTNVSFNGNSAAGYGGAAAFVGSGGRSEPTLSEVTFSSNTAGNGGALYVYSTGDRNSNTDVKIANGKFLDNAATSSDGGAIYQHVIGPDGDAAGGSLSVVNAVFAGNTSENNGGAMYFEVEVDGTSADPLTWEDARGFLTLISVSTYGNSAPHGQGGAIYAEAEAGTNSDVIIQNSILWGDTDGADSAEVHIIPGTGGHIQYSDLQGGCAPTGADCSSDHNLNADPLYAGAGSGMLWPQDASPVIDAGTNFGYPEGVTVDLAGEPRFVDYPGAANTGEGTPPIVDMGAYEVQFTCPAGPVVFVDQDATGSGSGNSWTDAYTDLAAALRIGVACSVTSEYWVAEGVYLPGNYDASDTFHIDGGMQVYGGFDGTETARGERDVKANVTILSGDIDGDDDDYNADGNFIAEDAGEIVGENPYHVVTIDGGEMAANPTNTILDGFTITGGYATGVGKDAFGGGLYCFGASDALCSPLLQDLVFSGNYATEGGGGLANDGQGGSSSPVINDATFTGNWAGTLQDLPIGAGGAIINRGQGNYEGIGRSNSIITNSTFIGNRAKLYGGAIYNDGTHDGESSPVVANSTFVGNQSAHYGGAVFNHAWDLGLTEASYAHVTFWGNSATYGGGSLATDNFEGGTANVAVTNTIFWGGSAMNGPEINSEGSTTIAHSVVQDAYDDSGTWQIDAIEGTGNTEADPLLSPLANNGGPTQTMALLAGSSALNTAGYTACADDPVTGLDQRGISRPRGGGCDIGAYEKTFLANDFDADYKADAAVLDKSAGNWFVAGDSGGSVSPAINFGGNSAIYLPVPGDYDGDGMTDVAVFQKATGNWFVIGTTDGFFTPALNFGNFTDYWPVPADYDGDGKTDPAVVGRTNGNWFVMGSHDGFFSPALNFGSTNFIPVPADYDGDWKADAAVYEKATGNWFVVGSTDGFFSPALNFGNASYIPVPEDYDGDGTADPAVFHETAGDWFAVGSTDGFFAPALNFGGTTATYTPLPADYDGDGRADAGVFDRATGNWFVVGSTDGFFAPALNFGGNASVHRPVVSSWWLTEFATD